MRSLSHFLCGSLIGLCVVSGQGATLTVDSKTIPGLTAKSPIVSHTIRLSGPIEEGDADLAGALVRSNLAGAFRAVEPLLRKESEAGLPMRPSPNEP